MDIAQTLLVMRDPAGIPAPPIVFQWLAVLTWVFHIAFVHLTMGSATLALYAYVHASSDHRTHWQRLSEAMTKVAKVSVSLLIVLGVAPLLFTQVIYDPQWYASNVLSARWAIAFIFTLIIAYCCWFYFYQANHGARHRHLMVVAVIALILFALDGLIMHVLAYQALQPDQWMSWYAPGGVVDTRGAGLHAMQWPRFLFILSLSIPAVGIYLVAYAQYFSQRSDYEDDYLYFVVKLGRQLAIAGFALALVPFLWWQIDHPAPTGLTTHFVGWTLPCGLMLMALLVRSHGTPARAYALLGGYLLLILMLAVWREIIRIAYLKPFGYSIADYPVHADWPSLVLFFTTLLGVGGSVGGFYLTLIYRAGRVEGLYTADASVARLGTLAVTVLGVWIAVFFIYGISIWLSNTFI